VNHVAALALKPSVDFAVVGSGTLRRRRKRNAFVSQYRVRQSIVEASEQMLVFRILFDADANVARPTIKPVDQAGVDDDFLSKRDQSGGGDQKSANNDRD
jgi:hypothetical protein